MNEPKSQHVLIVSALQELKTAIEEKENAKNLENEYITSLKDKIVSVEKELQLVSKSFQQLSDENHNLKSLITGNGIKNSKRLNKIFDNFFEAISDHISNTSTTLSSSIAKINNYSPKAFNNFFQQENIFHEQFQNQFFNQNQNDQSSDRVLNADIEIYKNQILEQKKLQSKLENELNLKEDKIKNLQKQIDSLEKQISESQSEFREDKQYQEQIQLLTQKNKELTSQLTISIKSIENLQKKAETNVAQIKSQYESQISSIQQEYDHLQNQYMQISENNTALQLKLSLQTAPLNEVDDQIDKILQEKTSTRQSYEKKLQESKDLIEKFKNQIIDQTSKITQLNLNIEKRNIENGKLKEQDLKNNEIIKDQEQEIANLNDIISTLKQYKLESEAQFKEFLQENISTKEKHESFLRSLESLLGCSTPDDIINHVRELLQQLVEFGRISKDGIKIAEELKVAKLRNEQLQHELKQANDQLSDALSSTTLANAGFESPLLQSQAKANQRIQEKYDSLLGQHREMIKENSQIKEELQATKSQLSKLQFTLNSNDNEQTQNFLIGTVAYLNSKEEDLSIAMADEFKNEKLPVEEIIRLWKRYDELKNQGFTQSVFDSVAKYMNTIDRNMEQLIIKLGRCETDIIRLEHKVPLPSRRKQTPLKQPVSNRKAYPSQSNDTFFTPRPSSSRNIFTPL